MLRVESHCHSNYSPDSFNKIKDMIAVCHKRGIDRLIITDHNTINGALAAKKIDPQLVIVGEEIKTTEGELLAAFVQQAVPKNLSPMEAIQRLREQDAFISVSHPFDIKRAGEWRQETWQAMLPYLDAVEVFNARCYSDSFNQQAQNFAEQHNLAGTVGSDAHTLGELGHANFIVPEFSNAQELRAVIRQAEYNTRSSSMAVRLVSSFANIYKRSTGWQLPQAPTA